MENIFITVTGVNHYFGMKPFKVGKIFKIVKDEENFHDDEAIRAELPAIDTIGYVANSSVIESAEDSHLHFAAKVNGQWIDPLSLLNQ